METLLLVKILDINFIHFDVYLYFCLGTLVLRDLFLAIFPVPVVIHVAFLIF